MDKPCQILIVEDDNAIASFLKRALTHKGYGVEVVSSGEEGLQRALEKEFQIVLSDLVLAGMDGLKLVRQIKLAKPGIPIILMTAFGSTDTVIKAAKFGAFDYLSKPFKIETLLETLQLALASVRHAEEPVSFEWFESSERDLVGKSRLFQTVCKEIGLLAPQKVTVLIRGETGTGKELVARSLHRYSDRENKPFVAVNCMAIPDTLLESELFGHERGAFTGAVAQRIGRFEQAHTGTIFLDEIGDISLSTQGKLLRVLQEKCIQRVGGGESIAVDVRIVAATNRDLAAAIEAKQFREDLYYRLSGGIIALPPLRERKEDIAYLACHFLQRYRSETDAAGVAISSAALQRLEEHAWPGNIRELENVIYRGLLWARGQMITTEIIREALDQSLAAPAKPSGPTLRDCVAALLDCAEIEKNENVHGDLMEIVERELFTQVFNRAQANQSKIAKWLGISRPTIHEKLVRYGLI